MSDHAREVEVSVVATVFEDAELVRPLVDAIRTAIDPLAISYEVVLVDDGSRDTSGEEIRRLAGEDARIKGVMLARNYGQQTAMSAGIHHAVGQRVVIMDGDLQNPPEEIPAVLERLADGHDVVYCVATTRDSWLGEVTSRGFWFVLTRLFGVRMVTDQLMMKGLSRRVVDHYARYQETNRVVAGIVADIGFRSTTHTVTNRRRSHGRSRQGLVARLRVAIDLLLEMTTAPLDGMVYLGLLGVLGALLVGAVLVALWFVWDVVPGYTSIVLAITFFGSLIVCMLGVIGRYLANIYREVRRRPLYLVSERLNL